MMCKICNKEFKKISTNHLKKHGYTLVKYLEEFEPELAVKRAEEKAKIDFINNFYITVRYRFLEYRNRISYTVNIHEENCKRKWPLCEADLKEHLQYKKTIGIYFPKKHSNLIGLDIDSLDILLLNEAFNTLVHYGINSNSILISYSGNKGYHIDIFLSQMTDKAIINTFYNLLITDLEVSKKVIELRGGSEQPYKLPFGIHYITDAYCYICDEWGTEVTNLDLSNVNKMDAQVISDIIEINDIENIGNYTTTSFAELKDTVNLLPIYQNTNENRIKIVEKLIDQDVHIRGRRQESIREVAAYCKDIKNYCIEETMEFVSKWVLNSWSKTIIDKEVKSHIRNTVKSVYKTNYCFNVAANKITITLYEIREVFSINTNNKLASEALRRLYYIFLTHAKAYAGKDGIFYMTYEQIMEMGANKNSSLLYKQISKLEELDKLLVVERNTIAPGEKFIRKPNKYKLPKFVGFEEETNGFTVCDGNVICKDCFYKALCYLESSRNRAKYIKGKAYKELACCQYNTNDCKK